MHTDESILPSSRKIKFIAVGVFCLLALYALSIGPVCKMDDGSKFSDRTNQIICFVYMPVLFLGSLPGMNNIINWYLYDVWNCDRMTTL